MSLSPSSRHRFQRSRSLRTLRLAASAGALFAAVNSWSAEGYASPAYAYVLATYFDFNGGCPSCHTNQAGGLGTVTKAFGISMMGLGLKADDATSLYEALTELETSGIDSDGDTYSDFDELSADGDPNDPAKFPADATPLPPAPPPATTTPATPPPATTTPATPPPATPPAPAPAPAPSKDDGGCSVTSAGNPSHTSWLVLGLFGLVLARRRSWASRR